MFSVELYGRVRYACHVEGLSQREAARRFGLHRNTVRKMLTFSVPPATGAQSRSRAPSSMPSRPLSTRSWRRTGRSEEHTSELQTLTNLVCRLLLEKKKRA